MSEFDLSNPAFINEDEARKVIEASRWPNGVFRPHCGVIGKASKLGGQSMGPGWYHCNACRDKFTVNEDLQLAKVFREEADCVITGVSKILDLS